MTNQQGLLRVMLLVLFIAWAIVPHAGWAEPTPIGSGGESEIARQLRSANTSADQMRAIDGALARQATSLSVRSALQDLSVQSRSASVRASARRALVRLQTLAPAVDEMAEESSHVLALRELKIPEDVEVVDDPVDQGKASNRTAEPTMLRRSHPQPTDVAYVEKQTPSGSILPVSAQDDQQINHVAPAHESPTTEAETVESPAYPCECPDPNTPAKAPIKRSLNRVKQTLGSIVRKPTEIMRKSEPIEWTESEVVEVEVVENPPLSAIGHENTKLADPPVGAVPSTTASTTDDPALGAFTPAKQGRRKTEAFATTHVAQKAPASDARAPKLKSPLVADEEFPSLVGERPHPPTEGSEVAGKPIPKASANVDAPVPTSQVVARKTPLVAPLPPTPVPSSPAGTDEAITEAPSTTPLMPLESIPRDPRARVAKAREMLTQGKQLARAGDWSQAEQILLQVRELAVAYRKWQYSPRDLERDILTAQSKASPSRP